MSQRSGMATEQQRKLPPLAAAWQPPMKATLVQEPPRGDWVYERKLDGYRIIAVCTEDGARIFSRSGIDVTHRYPFTGLPRRECVLDGEAVAFIGGRESFSAVQRGAATNLVLFDVLQLDGRDVRQMPWRERRPLLDGLDIKAPCARLPHATGDAAAMLERACAAGWEGLIAKRPDASYSSGRSRAWLKLKCIQGQEFVIGGFTDPAGSRTGLGALLVGYHEEGRLRYAGKVGTGFDDATLKRLRRRLEPLEVRSSPFDDPPAKQAHWVRPELVCHVDFTEWTDDGRLRHPRYLGLRDDKQAVEVVREA